MTEKKKEEGEVKYTPSKKEIMFKFFRAEVRAVDPNEEGVIDMLIPMSTGSVDRHGESIDPKGWKKTLKEFKKRAILLSSHAYRKLTNQIGELLDIQVAEEGLLARPKYYINQGNEEADWGYKLAVRGMAAFSVGFIPIKWEDSDGKDGKPSRTYLEQELVEISQVTVPSNRDAIQEMRSKSSDDFTNRLLDDVLGEEGLIEIIAEEKEDLEALEVDFVTQVLEKDVITEIEETKEYIRIPAKGEEGKHKGHKIRWMTISEKEGIKGIYCIDCKKIITYVFLKAKGWTLEKAKKWMKDNSKNISGFFEGMEDATLEDIQKEDMTTEDIVAEIRKIAGEKKADLYTKQIKEILPELSVDGLDFILELIKDRNELQEEVDTLNEKVKELELKVQEGLDSGKGDNLETKSGEEDNVVLEIEDGKEDDKHDKEEDEKTIEIDDEVIAKAVSDQMSYLVGKVKKDPTQK